MTILMITMTHIAAGLFGGIATITGVGIWNVWAERRWRRRNAERYALVDEANGWLDEDEGADCS